ncbi:hypothetical protein L3Q82_001473 [Scortum barcoo]|uniref:Uncharacterized protein n=1 Tax=Scortum barcoo TaxID=214431 RepID=A0ACB8W816_9TELE|nr:hypothetical protein L3Q82_001473 [Scortum barcoo]
MEPWLCTRLNTETNVICPAGSSARFDENEIVARFLHYYAAAEKLLLSFTVRDGDEITLPCENVIDGQQNCVYTFTWLFIDSGRSSTVELINLGQVGEGGKSKSDRLSVTANCSLVIKKVTVEDVGLYSCRQYKSGQQQGEGSLVYLSVINMNEQKDDDKVTLSCSVSSSDQCRHTVKWLYEGKDVDKDNKDMQTSQPGCYTTVSFLTSHHIYTSRLNLFTCNVTNGHTGKVQLFPFSLQSSVWLRVIIVSVGLTALIIIVVAVKIWTRTKEKETQMDENTEHHGEDEDEGVVNYENVGDLLCLCQTPLINNFNINREITPL